MCRCIKKYDQVIDLYDKDVKAYWNDKKETYYNASFQLANIIHRFHNTSNSMNVWAVAVMRNAYEFDLGKIHCQINEKNYPCHINKLFSLNQYVSIVTYKVEIPTSDIMEFEIQNKLKFVYQDENGYGFEKDVFIVLWLEEKARINKDLSRFLKRTIHRLIFVSQKTIFCI